MDDAQPNILTAVGVLLAGGALMWVLAGPGAQASPERIVPAAAVFLAGGLLIWLAWRRPGGEEQRPMTTPQPPSGGNRFNIGQQGGTANQFNINQRPTPRVGSAQPGRTNDENPPGAVLRDQHRAAS